MSKNAIELESITIAYNAKPVLFNVTTQFEKGKMTAIIGPNGAGKSTLMKSMLNLVQPIAGTVAFHPGEKVDQPYKEVKDYVAYVPQNSSVDWDFPTTALDVVLMGRYGKVGLFKRPGKEDQRIAEEMLDRVGMSTFKSRQISQLSGGQRQRVFLARALAQQADIYILDEPLAGVDMKTEAVIIDLLKGLIEKGKTVIVVHHDLQTVSDYFDNVVFLNKEIIVAGPVSDVFTEANINETYRKDRNLGEESGGGDV